jgi:AcrR family transcriptional regulator
MRNQEQIRATALDAAMALFSLYGFQAVTIDDIAQRSNITRRTLYMYFQSKEALAADVVERCSADWRAWFRGAVKDLTETPAKEIPALFDALALASADGHRLHRLFEWALLEFPVAGHPVREAALKHRNAVYRYLRKLARYVTRYRDIHAQQLAETLHLLFEGVVAVGTPEAARQAKVVVTLLLNSAPDKTKHK